MSRRIVQVERGLLRIEQRVRIARREIGTDVSGPACIYAVVRVRRGRVAYLHGDARVRAPRSFAVLLPPFAIVQASLERCDVTSIALAFRPLSTDRLPEQPVMFSTTGDSPPRSKTDALSRFHAAATPVNIGRVHLTAPVAAEAKAAIDREYGTPLEIGRIAARLQTPHAVLSRTFKQAYGVPPVRYRHHVRIMDALTRFADGAAPVDVFQEVGFDDLSRFYKIFRKVACDAPGVFRPGKSRIAKT